MLHMVFISIRYWHALRISLLEEHFRACTVHAPGHRRPLQVVAGEEGNGRDAYFVYGIRRVYLERIALSWGRSGLSWLRTQHIARCSAVNLDQRLSVPRRHTAVAGQVRLHMKERQIASVAEDGPVLHFYGHLL